MDRSGYVIDTDTFKQASIFECDNKTIKWDTHWKVFLIIKKNIKEGSHLEKALRDKEAFYIKSPYTSQVAIAKPTTTSAKSNLGKATVVEWTVHEMPPLTYASTEPLKSWPLQIVQY